MTKTKAKSQPEVCLCTHNGAMLQLSFPRDGAKLQVGDVLYIKRRYHTILTIEAVKPEWSDTYDYDVWLDVDEKWQTITPHEPTPAEIRRAAFLTAIDEVCKRHGISISHQDYHGAFVLVPYAQRYRDWLAQAELEN